MRLIRWMLPTVVLLAACDTRSANQLRTLAHTDSLRTDSLVSIKNELLNEVMSSTQFVNDLNAEVAKLKSRKSAKLSPALTRESDINAIKEERANVVAQDSRAGRAPRFQRGPGSIASRASVQALGKHDSTIVAQVEAYEKTIAELRQTVERQKAEYEATIAQADGADRQLTSRVDTVTKENVRLSRRAAPR